MFKRIKIVSIILVLLMLPVNAYAMDYSETLEVFTEKADIDGLIEGYQELLDNYDDSYFRFVKMSSRSSYSYHVAYTAINKLTGKLRLLWDIEKSKENILKTKADVLLSFRSQFYSLYNLEKAMNTSYSSYMNAIEDYNHSQALYNDGYVSKMETSTYAKQSAYYSYMSSKRRYDKALREFNLSIEKDYQFTAYEFSIDEQLLERYDVDEYIDYVLENSVTLKMYDRSIEEYGIKTKYLESYCLQITSQSAKYDYKKAMINLQIAELKREQYLENIVISINKAYDALSISEREIDNMKLLISINKNIMNENLAYYKNGYIEKNEYEEYVEQYEYSLQNINEKIYSYNTAVLNLEYMSCFYMKGEF